MKNKKKIGILFGGQSPEHEISLLSAKNIISNIDKTKFDLILIGIDKTGNWALYPEQQTFINEHNPKTISLGTKIADLTILPGVNNGLIDLSTQKKIDLDLVFPIIHGVNCEDGALQGALKIANLPFVGSGIMGSALCMDKDISKIILKEAGFEIAEFLTFKIFEAEKINYLKVINKLGLPIFVKPANTGSSIGISKVTNELEFHKAVKKAFEYDQKIIIEETILGREIECAVIGNDYPEASLIGEIISNHTFYSYEAKYLDDNGAVLS
ncbi:MAG: D-alanine--D-alanine ligase family protein, partial [Candidatus Margulisiibacteriota bacterium]